MRAATADHRIDRDLLALEVGGAVDAGSSGTSTSIMCGRPRTPSARMRTSRDALLMGLEEGHVVGARDHVDLAVGLGGQRQDVLLDGFDADVQPLLPEQPALLGDAEGGGVPSGQ
jgi:hypothetical protein